MHPLRNRLQELIGLTDAEWQMIADRISTRKIPRGGILVKEGFAADEIYFISEGLIRLYITADGKEMCRQFFFEGNFFAEYQAFLTRQPSKNWADALEDTTLIVFSYNDMQFFYKNIPSFQLVGRMIAENLFIKISERVNSLLTETPETRYQQLIADRPKVLQRIPQYMIASYLGISPEHLSRIRRKRAAK